MPPQRCGGLKPGGSAMDVLVCPSCGFRIGEPDEDAYKTTCRNCGRTVAITAHLGTGHHVVPPKKKPNLRKTLPKKVLMISVLAAVAMGAFAYLVQSLTPTAPNRVVKPSYAELNTASIDQYILSEGITAYYYQGWTEADTVDYIERRIADLEAINEKEKRAYIQTGMRTSELNIRSTASDVQNRTQEETQQTRERIEAREALVEQFEQILSNRK